MEEHAPENGYFFIRFVAFASTLVGCLVHSYFARGRLGYHGV